MGNGAPASLGAPRVSSRADKLERLLDEALGLDPADRASFLDRHCGSDHAMRREIEAALRLHDENPNVLELDGGEERTNPLPPNTEHDGLVPRTDGESTLTGTVLGDYLLLEEIGRGGMGVVYRARDQKLKTDVALKVIPRGLGPGGIEEKRLRLEAQNVARLDHPGIVRVRTCDAAGPWTWFVMDLVAGLDLDQELETLRGVKPEKPLQFEPQLPAFDDANYQSQAAELVACAADAVQHAHDQGIVHRDLKPKNMILGPNRGLRLVDFGIARPLGGPNVTDSGALAGTVYYMSPEVAQSARLPVDQRSDVYSLGVVLYELLTLKRPFEGKTSKEVLDRILTGLSPLPSRVNPKVARDLEAICLKAIAFNPEDRYPTAAALRDDLRRFLSRQAVLAERPNWFRRLLFRARRHRRELWAAGITLVLATTFGVWLLLRTQGAHRARWTITSSGPQASVSIARLNDIIGEPESFRELGRTPIQDLSLEAGFYRLRSDFGDGLAVDYEVEAVDDQHLSIAVRPLRGNTSKMSLIPGGTLHLVDPPDRICTLNRKTVVVGSFYMDRSEVSNGEYARFARETQRSVPRWWPKAGEEPAGWDRLPATQVTWDDAMAYASFHGKRLPTHAEWELASRGTMGRLYPWADLSMDPEAAGANIFQTRFLIAQPTEVEVLREYLRCAWPVDRLPGAASPQGVLHLFGNVDEWTSTPFVEAVRGRSVSVGLKRWTMGHNWYASAFGMDPSRHGFAEVTEKDTSYSLGFRCVLTFIGE